MMDSENKVFLHTGFSYDITKIKEAITDSNVLDIIKPGNKVVLKPNFVQESRDQDDDWDYVITHPTVITAVLELVCERLEGTGEIVIADAPMTPTRFDKLLEHMPVSSWKELCGNNHIAFSIVDLRDEEWFNAANGIILKKSDLPGDPMGKVLCDLLDDNSEFYGKKVSSQGYYGASYDLNETNHAHNGHNNQYSVSKTVMTADVLINIPKLKSHKKAGLTCCLKNLVGINTNKNLLPHHTSGTASEGGDQFSADNASRKLESWLTIYAKKTVYKFKFLTPLLVPLKNIALMVWGDNKKTPRSGGWYGNDTLWRTILDLNKVMFYANGDGSLKTDKIENRKHYIGIVDGILGGDGNGPLAPDKVESGFLILGTNPVAIDCIAAYVMGFDYKKISSVVNAFKCKKYRLADFQYEQIICELDHKQAVRVKDLPKEIIVRFRAASGWKGHIEADE